MNPRHRRFAIPTLGLVAALAASALAAAPAIAENGEKEVAEVTPIEGAKTVDELLSEVGATVVDADDFTSADSTRTSDGTVSALSLDDGRPTSFDLRDCDLDGDGKNENYVTPVKSQNPLSTCWTFGATAAAESSLLSELDKGTPAGTRNANLDLSEKGLAWFVKNPQPESSGSQAGEGIHTGSEDPVSKLGGGFISTATSAFAMGNGPLVESVDPVLEYHNNAAAENEQYYILDFSKMDEEKRQEVKEMLGLGDNYLIDTWMQARPDGDWSVPETYRGVQNWELEETYYLPSPASFEPTDDPEVKVYKYNEDGVNAIKDQLLAGRGVGIGFCADTSQPGQEGVPHYMRPDTFAHYTYESPEEGATGGGSNHAVCIVGYDDNYSRNNFYPEHQPDGDGAFIVKNSWGGNDVEDPRNYSPWGVDGTGYFYLSYYDKSIAMPEAFDFITDGDAATPGSSSEVTLYEYAFLPNDPTGTNYDRITSYANVYPMNEDSVIRDVATQTYSFGTNVRFDIYLLNEGATTPSDGKLLWSHEDTFPFGGYHRVTIDETLSVKKGDKVGVVCTSELPSGKYEVVNNQADSKLSHSLQYADPTARYWSEAIVNEGESFVGSPFSEIHYTDGTMAYGDYAWADYSKMIDRAQTQAQAALDEAGIPDLQKARDAAYANLSALDEGDEGYEAAEEALDAAQEALDSALEPIADTTARALIYAQDNFPLNITTEAVGDRGNVDMFRLYNPYTGEHLYTASTAEKANLLAAGWSDEGIGWTSPAMSDCPVFRLYNPYTGEHFYTQNAGERDDLVGDGWRDEGIGFYSARFSWNPVYRLNNPYEDGVRAHHFTTDPNERNANADAGWVAEGVAWYGI